MAENASEKKIIADVEMMKGLELAAKDWYTKISPDQGLKGRAGEATPENVALDEQSHAGIVQEIIDIVNSAL